MKSNFIPSIVLLFLVISFLFSPLPLFFNKNSIAKAANTNPEIYSNFTVSYNGYLTVYLYGIPSSSKVLLWWGIEPYPQGPWSTTSGTSGNMETPMTYNSAINAFQATIGPFSNGTWIGYVFNVNTSTWINYDNHAFWNWNVIINPPMNIIGYTKAYVLPNGSIVISTIGRPPDTMLLWYGLTTGPQTGLPWYNTAGTPGNNISVMTYNPLYGNYTVMIGPFKPGQWVQWVYHDNTTGWWIHNSNVSSNANFAIQDTYFPVSVISAQYSRYVYIVGQSAVLNVTVQNSGPTSDYNVLLYVNNQNIINENVQIESGISNISLTFPVNFPMGIYNTYLVISSSGLSSTYNLPQLYVLNTTNRKPLSLVIVWNMHQPLYIEPNGTWGQPWVQIHTGQDMIYNNSLIGAYELQAMLLNYFKNINVSIDFTPVLLYQWESFLHQSSPTFLTSGVNVSHDLIATNETIALYKNLIKEGRLQVLTVPFYHPLMAIEYDNGWSSDLYAQILMGENMTNYVFGVNANAAWTPEMAFNMGLVWLYNETGINVTVLDYQAFIQMAPDLTIVSGNLNLGPHGIYVVQNSAGQKIYVLFRDDSLSNLFGFSFFSQSPQLTQQELIQYLAKVYMQYPGSVDVVALDGENPIIFNPMPNSAYELYAIYQALSEYQGPWLVTQTLNQAIQTHNVSAVLTNLPEESWATSLNNWNNGYEGKVLIWQNVSLAREYLIAYSSLIGEPISPIVPLSFKYAPNASITEYSQMISMPPFIPYNMNEANPLSMYYTLWNYLYVSEGSDWTWQAGPPNYGPAWFAKQPIIYDTAIDNYVKNAFSMIVPESVFVSHSGFVFVLINNSLGASFNLPIHLVLVVNNGTTNVSENVIIRPGISIVRLYGLTASPGQMLTVYLYSPINKQEVGASLIPISNYGLLIGKYNLTADTANYIITLDQPQLTFNSFSLNVANATTSTPTISNSNPSPISTLTPRKTSSSLNNLFNAIIAFIIIIIIAGITILLTKYY